MDRMLLENLIPLLQVSVSPVILISAVGLLLLSMTNRYARIFERTHQIIARLPHVNSDERKKLILQVRLLLRQAYLIRTALAFGSLSVLCASCLIFLLFVSTVFQLGFPKLIASFFVFTIISLLLSLIFFFIDINISLNSLKVEVGLLKLESEKNSKELQ
ncbi:MAG: DUF2721 domain-containing protein [Acidobacteria bacterium]|nr:DUF2721 domain-containing protein [Acidobacteriota bacterium]